jgi:hypothetical protein
MTGDQGPAAVAGSMSEVQVPGGALWPICDEWEKALSKPAAEKGKLQRSALALLLDHEDAGMIPTSIRFLFYELVTLQVLPKSFPGKAQPHQYLSNATMVLREAGIVPWDWLVDETRSLTEPRFASTVAEYVAETVDLARVDLWDGSPPPLVLTESRSLAGVLSEMMSVPNAVRCDKRPGRRVPTHRYRTAP